MEYNPQDPATWPCATGFFGPGLPPRVRPDGRHFWVNSLDPDTVRAEAVRRLGPLLQDDDLDWPLVGDTQPTTGTPEPAPARRRREFGYPSPYIRDANSPD